MRLGVCALLISTAEAFFTRSPSPGHTLQRCASPVAEGPSPLVAPLTDNIWDMSPPLRVEGNSLKTWDIGEQTTKRVQLSLRSTGRPIDANIELWNTPSYIPTKFSVYCEDGQEQPFHTIIETPNHPKTLAVFNTEGQEFPFEVSVVSTDLGSAYESLAQETPDLVQGGQIKSYVFDASVESIQVLLRTSERNMKAMIEVTQGPNDDNQVIELDATVGHQHPFYTVIQTPGAANTLRIINQNTVEFPFDAYVLPYEIVTDKAAEVDMGSGGKW